MKKNKTDNFSQQLEKGLKITFEKLVKQKQQRNGVLFFSKNGKIVKIKATDIKL
jgi:predicted secreted hydrolase